MPPVTRPDSLPPDRSRSPGPAKDCPRAVHNTRAAGPFGLVLLLLSLPTGILAQNTGTVFSPDVTAGRQGADYRLAFDPDGDRFAHRLHYQYAFSESWRLRIIGLQSAAAGSDLEFRYVRAEALWQFLEDEEAGWDSALRFEVQIAEGDNLPHRWRIAWTSKINLTEQWQTRFILLTGTQFGPQGDSSLLLGARGQLAYRLNARVRLGLELYTDLNTIDDPGSFEEQEHQLGPLLSLRLADDWSGNLSAIFGISEAADDAVYRLQLVHRF